MPTLCKSSQSSNARSSHFTQDGRSCPSLKFTHTAPEELRSFANVQFATDATRTCSVFSLSLVMYPSRSSPQSCGRWPGGEIGRRTGLKILGPDKGRTGSIPVLANLTTLRVGFLGVIGRLWAEVISLGCRTRGDYRGRFFIQSSTWTISVATDGMCCQHRPLRPTRAAERCPVGTVAWLNRPPEF